MNFERPNIAAMHGYVPGEQLAGSDVIKLNTNENPYPPSPAVSAALASLRAEELRLYPPPLATEFRASVAALHGLETSQVIATNGGDELLRLVLTTFVSPGEKVAIAQPSYSLYPVLAAVQDCRLESFELDADWSLPADFTTRLSASAAKLCILVNPQAPSGRLLPLESMRALAGAFNGLLLLDEAYVDFVDPELGYDSTPLVREFDNVLLLRTLSKGYSLAGLRMGYGLGSQTVIEPMLTKTRDSYNTDLIAQRLASAAIGDQDYARQTWALVRQSRQQMTERLSQMGFTTLPSQTNFLLTRVPEGHSAAALQQALKQQQILVRYFDQPRLRDMLRISIGSETENQRLLEALQELLHSL